VNWCDDHDFIASVREKLGRVRVAIALAKPQIETRYTVAESFVDDENDSVDAQQPHDHQSMSDNDSDSAVMAEESLSLSSSDSELVGESRDRARLPPLMPRTPSPPSFNHMAHSVGSSSASWTPISAIGTPASSSTNSTPQTHSPPNLQQQQQPQLGRLPLFARPVAPHTSVNQLIGRLQTLIATANRDTPARQHTRTVERLVPISTELPASVEACVVPAESTSFLLNVNANVWYLN